MKFHSDHPFVEEMKSFAHTDDDDVVTETARVSFASYEPTARTQLLNETKKLIGDDDGVGLRQKAQLMTLHRELKTLDAKMRAAGR